MENNVTILNLEEGMPVVDQAMETFAKELFRRHNMGFKVMKLIHGFGSTGKGGKIRTRIRRDLPTMRQKGQILDFVTGENFSIFDATTRKILDIAPSMREDGDLDRHNNGVTIIIM